MSTGIGGGPKHGELITTKNPLYIKAMKRLEVPGSEFNLEDAALIIGVEVETARRYCVAEKIDFFRKGRSYWFKVNALRVYLGRKELEESE